MNKENNLHSVTKTFLGLSSSSASDFDSKHIPIIHINQDSKALVHKIYDRKLFLGAYYILAKASAVTS